jgi:hypothetical protein
MTLMILYTLALAVATAMTRGIFVRVTNSTFYLAFEVESNIFLEQT